MKGLIPFLLITCSVVLNPDGWFGLFTGPRTEIYEVTAWWHVQAADTTLSIHSVLGWDPETLTPVARREVGFNAEQWASYSCVGCAEPVREGECY